MDWRVFCTSSFFRNLLRTEVGGGAVSNLIVVNTKGRDSPLNNTV